MTRTASCYTNKVRVVATASNLKVDYPGKIAVTPQPLAPTLPCYPSYTPITYIPAAKCPSYKPVCLQPVPPPPVLFSQWRFNESGSIPPGTSQYSKFDFLNGDRVIYVSILDLSNTDQSAFLLSMQAGGTLTFSSSNETSVWTVLDSPISNFSFITIDLINISVGPPTGSATYPNILLTYTPP